MADTLEQLILALAQADSAVAGSDPYASPQAAVDKIVWDPSGFGVGENAAAAGIKGLLSGLFGELGNDYKQRATSEYQNILLGANPERKVLPEDLFRKGQDQLTVLGLLKNREDQKRKEALSLMEEELKLRAKYTGKGKDSSSKNPYYTGEAPSLESKVAPASSDSAVPVAAPVEMMPTGREESLSDAERVALKADKILRMGGPGMTPEIAYKAANEEVVEARKAATGEIGQGLELVNLGQQLEQVSKVATKTGAGRSITRLGDQILAMGNSKVAQDTIDAENKMKGLGFQVSSYLKKPGEGAITDSEREVLSMIASDIGSSPEANVAGAKAVQLLGKRQLSIAAIKERFPGEPAKAASVIQKYIEENPIYAKRGSKLIINPSYKTFDEWASVSSGASKKQSVAPYAVGQEFEGSKIKSVKKIR